MMETMIPPQVGMRLRTKNKKKKERKEAIKKRKGPNKKRKNERKREKGQCYYPFTTLVLQSSTMIFMIESLLCCHFHILVGFFIIELGFYIPMMGFLKIALGIHEKASWMHTHLVSFVEISYIYSSSAFVAWQSLLLALTSIDGHLHSPLISRINVRLSPFCLLTQPQSLYSIPPIVLCPWLALIYCVKLKEFEKTKYETISWLVIGVVHDESILCDENEA